MSRRSVGCCIGIHNTLIFGCRSIKRMYVQQKTEGRASRHEFEQHIMAACDERFSQEWSSCSFAPCSVHLT